MKKQIKQVRIDIDTKGAKEARDLVAGINKELDSTAGAANKLDAELKGSVATLENLYNRAAPLSTALTTAATSAGKLSRALNGGTAKAEKGVSSYIDNLEILSMSLKEVSAQAATATDSMSRVTNTGDVSSTASSLDDMLESLTSVVLELKELNEGSRITNARLKETRDSIHSLGATADRTEEELQQMNYESGKAGTNFTNLDKKTRKARKGLEGLGRTAGRTGKHLSKMSHGGMGLAGTYAVIAANVFALSESFRIVTEAANFDRLTQQTASFSAAVSGVNVKLLAQQMQEASAGAMNLRDSLQFATKGVAFDFTAKQLENLTRGARKASIALGIDFADAMDRVLRGISKQEIELFDELGVVTRLTPAFANYAATIGKTIDQLTDYERQTALTIEVQKQLDERFKGVKLSVTGWEQLNVAVSNFTTQALVKLSRQLDSTAEAAAKLFERFTDTPTAMEFAGESLKAFNAAIKAGDVIQAANAMEEYRSILITTAEEVGKGAESAIKAREKEVAMVKIATEAFIALSVAIGLVYRTAAISAVVKGSAILVTALAKIRNAVALLAFGFRMLALANPIGLIATLAVAAAAFVGLDMALDSFSDSMIKPIEDTTSAMETQAIELNRMIGVLKKQGFDTQTLGFNAQAALAWNKALSTTNQELSKLLTGVKAVETPLDKLVIQFGKFSSANVPTGLGSATKPLKDLHIMFLAYQSSGVIPDTMNSFDEFNKALATAAAGAKDYKDNFQTELKVKGLEMTGMRMKKLTIIQAELAGKQQEYARAVGVSNISYTDDQRIKLANDIKILKAREASVNLADKQAASMEDLKVEQTLQLIILRQALNFESEITTEKIKQLAVQSQILLDEGKDNRALERKIQLLKGARDNQEVGESVSLVKNTLEDTSAGLNKTRELAGSEVARLAIDREILAIRESEAMLMTDKVAKNAEDLAISRAKAELSREEAAAPFADASSLFSNLQGLEGLSSLQNTGLDMASNFSDVFAQAEESGKGFTDFLMGNAEAFQEFGISMANSANSIFQELSKAKVASIDMEIAAEKKRDGKSVESLAKIKKLESKKIKEEAKAKKASVLMSTSMAIMQGYAQLGPIAGTAAAVAMGLMGALQIANIDKAASGQMASLDGGGLSGMKITGGTRDNSVDVSKQANAGELSFVTGGGGIGSSGNFQTPGRAGFGTVNSGSSTVVGETGPEVITPLVPVSVSSGSSTGPSSSINFAPVFNVQAVDSGGMEELFQRYSKELYDGLEREMSANNQTLASV